MGFRRMRDKTFLVSRIRDWLQNCHGIRHPCICEIRDWPQNHRGIQDSNISRESDKGSKLFRITESQFLEMVEFHLIAREIEIEELTPQNIKR